MTRWAIYARYSDEDKQNARSIDDQVRDCREAVTRKGGKVFAIYSDAGKSGAHTAQRPEYRRMVQAFEAREFDCIMAEDTDRLARSLKDMSGLYDIAEFVGGELWTLLDGRIDMMRAAFKGMSGQDFLRNLAHKVRRGLIGVVERGGIPGGLCYGYDVSEKAKRTVNEQQAAIVIRIYREYAANKSPRRIVADLNREGVKGPRGGLWRVSTLLGNPKRLNGTLNNPIYRGELVFNRQGYRKNPRTGKRAAIENPPDKWLRENHPHLRIVDDELWDAVQARRAGVKKGALSNKRRPRSLLGGLITCLACGGPMNKIGDYYVCAAHRERGTCSNGRGLRVDRLETITIDAMRATLTDPVLIARFAKVFRRQIDKRLAEENAAINTVGRRLADLERKISNLTKSVETGLDSPSIRQRLGELERERTALANAPVPVSAQIRGLIPDARILAEARAANENLVARLKGDDVGALTAREAFRSAIAGIRSGPVDGKERLEIDGNIKGTLLLAGCPDISQYRWLRE